jgi:hypothetical protein
MGGDGLGCQRLLPIIRLGLLGVCYEQNGRCRRGCFSRQVIGISSAPGALNGKISEPRAMGTAVRRETNGNGDEVRAAASTLNGKPNLAEPAPPWSLRLRRRIGT